MRLKYISIKFNSSFYFIIIKYIYYIYKFIFTFMKLCLNLNSYL